MRKNDLTYRSEKYVRLLRNLFWKLMQKVFRIEIEGLENLPTTESNEPCLMISNHNSGAVIESHSLLFALLDRHTKIYGLNHPSLFHVPLLNQHFRKIGAVTASREVALEVLKSKASLLIFPGGNRQAFRPWSQRYDHTFDHAKGWAEIAIEAKVPVIPIRFLGSHNVNPILISNQFVSKLLVLPWLLGVKWFPVSISQIALATAAAMTAIALGAPAPVTALLTYLTFCFTPLVPILPAKIKIQIGKAIQTKDRTPENLREEMSSLMGTPAGPTGRRRIYPLNALERFMLLHESDTISYNSHLVFDFEVLLDRQKILETTEKWIQALPQVRSCLQPGLWRSQRYSYDQAWFTANDLVTFQQGLSDEATDTFCQRPFKLESEPAVRLLVLTEGSQNRIVFSCHHSLFDGAAQAFAFEEWSRLYNGLPANPKLQKLELFRYRNIRNHFGWKQTLRLIWENFQLAPPRMKINVATLASKPESISRSVKAKVLRVHGPSKLRSDFYAQALRSVDHTLREIGDGSNPIIAYMPVGLRFLLKIRDTLQNTVVSHTFFLKRNVVSDGTMPEKIQARVKADPLKSNTKFLFGCLPLCALGKEAGLKKNFAQLDSPTSPITSTVLLVSAPIPRAFPTPNDWKNLFISARGTLLKSPAVGIVYTGKPGFETVTVEYVEDLVSAETVDRLIQNLQQELHFSIHSNSDFDSKTVSISNTSSVVNSTSVQDPA